jgi:cell division septum initiation protein DivIVA
LAAIFAAATIPIYIMGGSLEIAKLVCASWLKANWSRAPGLMKWYMTTAVIVLMIITSMGIFGFLSKAHSESGLISGDVTSKIAIYDEKIKTAKENVEASRKQLKQMDEAVDQIMGRSTDEKGADKANAVRRSQQRDRTALAKDIEANQRLIASLNDEAAPIRAEVRKVEAEVGPIKYIAAFVYGDNPDANLLEKAVTWVIIIIVSVFDPLAVIMLLAAQMTFGWRKEEPTPLYVADEPKPDYEQDDGPLTDDQVDQLKKSTALFTDRADEANALIAEIEKEVPEVILPEEPKEFDISKHAYLHTGFAHFKDLQPMVHKPEPKEEEAVPNITVDAVVEFVPAEPTTVDTTEVKVDEKAGDNTYQIFPDLEEESKKKTYMIKDQGHQVVKSK